MGDLLSAMAVNWMGRRRPRTDPPTSILILKHMVHQEGIICNSHLATQCLYLWFKRNNIRKMANYQLKEQETLKETWINKQPLMQWEGIQCRWCRRCSSRMGKAMVFRIHSNLMFMGPQWATSAYLPEDQSPLKRYVAQNLRKKEHLWIAAETINHQYPQLDNRTHTLKDTLLTSKYTMKRTLASPSISWAAFPNSACGHSFNASAPGAKGIFGLLPLM